MEGSLCVQIQAMKNSRRLSWDKLCLLYIQSHAFFPLGKLLFNIFSITYKVSKHRFLSSFSEIFDSVGLK